MSKALSSKGKYEPKLEFPEGILEVGQVKKKKKNGKGEGELNYITVRDKLQYLALFGRNPPKTTRECKSA